MSEELNLFEQTLSPQVLHMLPEDVVRMMVPYSFLLICRIYVSVGKRILGKLHILLACNY